MCVGVHNQRYFLFFLFWCLLVDTHGIVELTGYYNRKILPHSSLYDLFLPWNMYHVVTGELSVFQLYYISVMWGVILLLPMIIGMFCSTVYLTVRGLTKFEFDHDIKVKDTRSIPARLRAALGRNWGVTLVLPFLNPGPVHEDAVNWPFIKT